MAGERSPMANFHHETDDDYDDTIELSVEERWRRLLRKVKRERAAAATAAKPFKSLERTKRTNERTNGYGTIELSSSSSSSWRRSVLFFWSRLLCHRWLADATND